MNTSEEDQLAIYNDIIAGKDSRFWKALEKWLDDVISRTRVADDTDELDNWRKVGQNQGARKVAQEIKFLVNSGADQMKELKKGADNARILRRGRI